jgi:predicted nucleotide-binding protein (sugar kinase/HSP70/actin superfamily)
MVTIEEVLVHPLTLLLIGGGVSSLVIPWITNKWQDHRKELEIKVEIASKMSELIAKLFGSALTSSVRKKQPTTDAERDSVYENIAKLFVDFNIIRSKLQSYYSDTEFTNRWYNYWVIINNFYFASLNYFDQQHPEAKNELEKELENIKDYFSNDKSINLNDLTMTYNTDMWQNVYSLLFQRADEIIRDVLKRRIKVF